MIGDEGLMGRRIGPRKLALVAVGLMLTVFLGVVAARTEVIAIVDTGDGDKMALATVALLQGGGGKVITPSGGGDNFAVAINTKDGTTLFETAFLITYAASGVVDQTNAAIAYSSCESCRTFAAAIEVVLVPADKADIVTPTNLAIAVNEGCLSCETAAFATQLVLGVDGPVRFTEEGNEQIEEIQEDLKQLEEEAEELTLEEIQARYDELVARLKEVLANELVHPGDLHRNGGEDPEDTTPGETTSETPSTTESTEPEETAPVSPELTTTTPIPPEKTIPEETTPAVPQQRNPVPEPTAPQAPQPGGEEAIPVEPTPGDSKTVP